ncbi:TNT domain-containing protein, partial [Actinoalloteichus spitiensis]|uniref:TNT domain-containing protein n=1 Tax=Actinoalloteichus spitiensis TaxID=252394 RepID=UPI00037EA217
GAQPKPVPFRPEFPVGGGTAVPPGTAVAPAPGQAPVPAPGQQPAVPVAGAAPAAKQVIGPGSPEGPAAPPAEGRTTRRAPTPQGELPEVASFVMHLFPLGRIPVPEVEPARQRPAPGPDHDYAPGGRYAPQDHPRADLVDTLDTPRAEDTEGTGPRPGPEGAPPPGAVVAVPGPAQRSTDHDWARRFVVRGIDLETGRPPEYAWPPPELFPEGAADPGGLEPVVLPEGAELDRFGDEEGRLLCRAGAAFESRSLPPDHADREYARYRVTRPLPVWAGATAAWFAQPGGAVRYRTTYAVAELVAMGYLDRLDVAVTGGGTT